MIFNPVISSLLLDLLISTVDVEHNEEEGSQNGRKSAKNVGPGDKQETFEFVMFVRTDGDSFCLFDEIIAGFAVVYFELIDAFFLRGLC